MDGWMGGGKNGKTVECMKRQLDKLIHKMTTVVDKQTQRQINKEINKYIIYKQIFER